MQISLSDSGKRFNREWIFRKLTYQFHAGGSYAITGPNGSGKSTLLQVIAGAMTASEGKINYTVNGRAVDAENIFRHISLAAPYQEVIEEMTLREFLTFHQKFKPFVQGWNVSGIISYVNLERAADKQIRYFSSGMKQRVKLAQAFFSESACLLLDEPCTNLDIDGIELYQRLIAEQAATRIVIVSSNDKTEYGFCREVLSMGSLPR